jgi:hypothetical protein
MKAQSVTTLEGIIMSKKKKKPRKSLFPWEVDDKYLIIAKKGNEILTDAGWEKMTFEEACQFFAPEEIRDWYVSCYSHTDISHLIVDMNLDIDLEDDEAVENFLSNHDWIPKEVQVVVAKAIYENHYWARVLTVSTPDMEESYFQNYEIEAIYLGIHLRKYLNLDIPIINDCKNAVRYLFGRYPNIGWQPRNFVTKAHKLKTYQATMVYNQQSWEAEWDEEVFYED